MAKLYKKNHILFPLICLVFLFIFTKFVFAQTETPTPTPTPTPAASDSQKKDDLQKQISELEGKISGLKSQANSLSSQIKIIDSQVALTELKIANAQEEIKNLKADIEIAKNKISSSEGDLEKTSKAFIGRAEAVYKQGSIDPWQVILTSNTLDNFFTRLKYLKIVQLFDKKQIYAAEQAKVNYSNQQEILEDKKREEEALNKKLQAYNDELSRDKDSKKKLLAETQGSEANYQRLLAQARAEYAAIQGIVAGNGAEIEAGRVNEGERIASVISGASCNSSGGHLHFIVRKNGTTESPFSYLRSVDSENCSGSSCGSSDGDAFNPSGGWGWPLNPKIIMNQGYGQTWAVRNTWVGRIYNFHNGIDITGSSLTVNAVKSGILYRGSYAGGGGCRLPYVRLKHDEDGIDTFYLHVSY